MLLVTDMGFLNEFGHVWETMEDISGDAHFLDAAFKPQNSSGHVPFVPEYDQVGPDPVVV